MVTISLSLRGWVFETYFKNYTGKNRSEYIEMLIVAGYEAIEKHQAIDKSHTLKLLNENQKLTTQIKHLNKTITTQQNTINKLKNEQKEKDKPRALEHWELEGLTRNEDYHLAEDGYWREGPPPEEQDETKN